MNSKLTPQLKLHGALALALFDAAALTARITAKTIKDARRPQGRGCTLRPGPETPLWNELVRFAKPHLQRRGTKTHLARLLGVPRQRLHDFFNKHTAAPDAERTLLLLCWVAAQEEGRELLA